jgi:hypothetical protein
MASERDQYRRGNRNVPRNENKASRWRTTAHHIAGSRAPGCGRPWRAARDDEAADKSGLTFEAAGLR